MSASKVLERVSYIYYSTEDGGIYPDYPLQD